VVVQWSTQTAHRSNLATPPPLTLNVSPASPHRQSPAVWKGRTVQPRITVRVSALMGLT